MKNIARFFDYKVGKIWGIGSVKVDQIPHIFLIMCDSENIKIKKE